MRHSNRRKIRSTASGLMCKECGGTLFAGGNHITVGGHHYHTQCGLDVVKRNNQKAEEYQDGQRSSKQ